MLIPSPTKQIKTDTAEQSTSKQTRDTIGDFFSGCIVYGIHANSADFFWNHRNPSQLTQMAETPEL